MSNSKMILFVLAMALVTYIIRAIPLVFIKRKIKSEYLRALLGYMPYGVLSAMTFPYIFYSTGNIYTALAGTAVALVASLCKRSLITVALFACLAALGLALVGV